MKKFAIYVSLTVGLSGSIWIDPGYALIVSPAQHQTPEQQQKDQQECAERASRETRIDPNRIEPPGPKAVVPLSDGPSGEGTGSEALDGPSGKSAQASPEQLAWRKRASVYGHTKALYDRAYGLCLERRGYTVN